MTNPVCTLLPPELQMTHSLCLCTHSSCDISIKKVKYVKCTCRSLFEFFDSDNQFCRVVKKPGLPSWMKKSKAAKEAEKEKATPSPEFFSNDGSFMDRFLAMQGEN